MSPCLVPGSFIHQIFSSIASHDIRFETLDVPYCVDVNLSEASAIVVMGADATRPS